MTGIGVLVHDEKHLLKLYIKECLENGDLTGIACITFVDNHYKFRDEALEYSGVAYRCT